MKRLFLPLALFLAAIPAVAQDELPSVAELLTKLSDTFKEDTAWSADITQQMDMMMKMDIQGTMIAQGAKSATDLVMKFDLPPEMAAQAPPMMAEGMKMKTVMGDDQIQWVSVDVGGMQQVMKMDMTKMGEMSADMLGIANPAGGPGNMFEMLKDPEQLIGLYEQFFDMKVVRKDTIGGVEVYVLEGTMKLGEASEKFADAMEAAGGFGEKITMAIGAEDGMMRSMSMGPAEGPANMKVTMSNLKFGVDLPENAFEFTPPDGVEVMDMTEMMEQAEAVEEQNGRFAMGDVAPDFVGKTVDLKTVKLSDYAGKVVLIDFWATWCGPCIQELPNVIDAYEQYHPKGLEIIGVSLDDEQEALETFLGKNPKVTWLSIYEGMGWDSKIGEQYGVNAIPYTVLVGKDGKIVASNLRGEELGKKVGELLD